MIRCGPFQEFNLSHKLRPDPDAFLHVLSGQAFAPSPFVHLGKVDERAIGRHQTAQPSEHLPSRGRYKTIANAGHVQAWTEVEQRLGELAAARPGRKLELISVQYDPMFEESLIEELPDQPKSSRPQAVEVAVRLRVTYELR
jgi:hypothetical protein